MIQIRNSEVKEAKIEKGVRQGCNLSPSLFNVYIEHAMKECKEKCIPGIKVNGKRIQMLRFADDIAILAGSKVCLQRALDGMAKILQKYNLKINKKKTEVMACSRKPIEISMRLGGKPLKQVNTFTYFGSKIRSDGRCAMDIRTRIAQAKQAFNKKKQLLTSKKLEVNVRK